MIGAGALALLLVGFGALAPGQVAPPVEPVPQGEPRSGGELRDPDFRVTTREFALDRRVEVYQWKATEAGYQRVWHRMPIDSSGFTPGHENPPALLIESDRWWAPNPTLDGAPLDDAVVKSLGRWRPFRPGFSRLPANLAASFQPEGDGLGTAENPLDPQVGDLRVNWYELALPPLAGEVALRNGTWQLKSDIVPLAQDPRAMASAGVAAPAERVRPLWPWLFVVMLLPVLVIVAIRRRN
ncbi:MAG: TMEM43 family protein [Pseudomonadota bacterium]|nr:TMEM43 family protein [Pseudomonadota bacterium]